jgi:hypothetical protein
MAGDRLRRPDTPGVGLKRAFRPARLLLAALLVLAAL